MTIHISHQHKAVIVPYRPDIAILMPHAKRVNWNGQEMIAVRHGGDETRLMRNMGMDVPAPIAEYYGFPGAKPFIQQVKTAALLTTNPRAYVLNQMGTGKTKSCLWAFDWLRQIGEAKCMLVVAPLSTLRFVWMREATMTIAGVRVRILDGAKARRIKQLAEPADIYVINHDGIKVLLPYLQSRKDIDVVCFDEVGAFRNAQADRSKIARALVDGRKFVWGMTGSPTPTAPTDAYGLARLITPATAPKSFTHFRNEVMVPIGLFNWRPKKDAADAVSKILQPSVCFTLEDTIELPQVIERPTDVWQGPKQIAAYKDLADKATTALRDGTITAANGGVALSKLLQVSSGYVYLDNGKTVGLDNHDRLQAMVDIIDSSAGKVIVFAPFIHTVKGIDAHLKKEGLDYAVVTGDTTSKDRDDIFKTFQNTTTFDVLLAHPQCMAHGLTLTAADTIIWFSPITSLEIFEQANARITRVGQTRKQQVFMLQGTSAERRVYTRLREKRNVQEGVLDLLKGLTD